MERRQSRPLRLRHARRGGGARGQTLIEVVIIFVSFGLVAGALVCSATGHWTAGLTLVSIPLLALAVWIVAGLVARLGSSPERDALLTEALPAAVALVDDALLARCGVLARWGWTVVFVSRITTAGLDSTKREWGGCRTVTARGPHVKVRVHEAQTFVSRRGLQTEPEALASMLRVALAAGEVPASIARGSRPRRAEGPYR